MHHFRETGLIRGCAVTAALALASALFTTASTADAVDELAWMAGYWTSTSDAAASASEELWLPPAGDLMVGVHRDLRNNTRVFFEYLRIETRSAGVYYVSRPSNQAEAAFRLTGHTPGESVTFENPNHDFPQQITYTLAGDVLTATISGVVDGEEKSSVWTFERTPFDKEEQ